MAPPDPTPAAPKPQQQQPTLTSFFKKAAAPAPTTSKSDNAAAVKNAAAATAANNNDDDDVVVLDRENKPPAAATVAAPPLPAPVAPAAAAAAAPMTSANEAKATGGTQKKKEKKKKPKSVPAAAPSTTPSSSAAAAQQAQAVGPLSKAEAAKQLAKLSKSLVSAIRRVGHTGKNKPYSTVSAGISNRAAGLQLLGGHGDVVSDSTRMHKRVRGPAAASEWLGIPRLIEQARFTGRCLVVRGSRGPVYTPVRIETLEVKVEGNLLTAKARTYKAPMDFDANMNIIYPEEGGRF